MQKGSAKRLHEKGSKNWLCTGHSGLSLGQILAGGGERAYAIKVLEIAATAFDKLGELDQTTQCRTLIDQPQGDTP